MKQKEFVKLLRDLGATFEEGAKHLKVRLNGKSTTLPRHPSDEMKKGTIQAIKRQLDIK